MPSRREFLSAAAVGATTLAASNLLAKAPTSGDVMPTKGNVQEKPLPTNRKVEGRYHLPHRFGLGGVALGNGFAPTTDEQAEQTMAAAWEAGVRYFDTSPFYGYGLSERRMGHFLHRQPAESYVLSTKVGRVFHATEKTLPPSLWKSPAPFAFKYDYTAEGTRRSIEDSLQRLGVSQIDIVFIHDLSPDNEDLGENWTEQFDVAAKGAMPELTKMRDEGVIKAWGFGVNRPEPALKALEVADPDVFLLACQYSLLDHQQALEKTFPQLAEKKVPVVVGSPLLAGYLAGRDRYLYGDSVPEGAESKRQKVMAVADKFGIDLRTASLQFAAASPVACSVIPGARSAEQVRANVNSMKVAIPADFWATLKEQKLIARDAPTPGA